MKVDERKTMREKLEPRLEVFRRAARKNPMQRAWLRELRQALGVPAAELAHRLKTSRAFVYRAEQDEKTGSVTLGVLDEVAHAMGCRVVYGLVPYRDESLEEVAADLRKDPRRDTPQIVARRAKGTKKRWDDLQEWRQKRVWEKAADQQAAALRKRILERAKSYNWSAEAAEAAEAAERDGEEGAGNKGKRERGNDGQRDKQTGTGDHGFDWEREYPPVPRTPEEMRRVGVGGAEAIRAALAERLRRR